MMFYLKSLLNVCATYIFFFTQNDTSYFELRMLKSHQKEVKINASKEDIDYGFPTTPTHTPKN